MSPRHWLAAVSVAVVLASVRASAAAAAIPEPGPFFEPEQPFFQAQVQLVDAPKGSQSGGNFVVRGILLPLGATHCAVFDQELMRLAGIWEVPAGQPPVTMVTMAPISYASPKRKAASDHPKPTGALLITTGMHPGVGDDLEKLFDDPRPPRTSGDEGRGALPVSLARFSGIDVSGPTAVLHYQVRDVSVREWHELHAVPGGETRVLRHFEVGAHAAPLHFALGRATTAWAIADRPRATAATETGGQLQMSSNHDAVTFRAVNEELVATLAAATTTQRFTVALVVSAQAAAAPTSPAAARVGATPPPPQKLGKLRWPGSASAPTELESVQQNGLVLDRIAVPEDNPWKRRVRSADIAFLTDDQAAVVAYDGDVWIVEGFEQPEFKQLTWRRFSSGLHEPLALAFVDGAIQVATKNGVVRVHDRDGNGEADWFENFNDQLLQSQTTRSFPLDMGIGPDGSTYISQGGIVSASGLQSGGEGTAHTGGILKISPDGRSSTLFASGAREPFLSVHPRTGVVTATDQQGNYIPSSVSYLVREGAHFGFMEAEPKKLTPPLVWIPHDQDISSSSETWVVGKGMGVWDGKLLHLSYGTGRILLISPDLDAPTPQGAAIPLDLKTDLPLLHARMNRRGDALFVAGFQIWGTRTTTSWALGRLRPSKTPITTPIAARSIAGGVVLTFAEPVDVASLQPEKVKVRAWNYKRSSAYGSGRYTLDGPAGTTPWGVAQVVASQDRKSVFIHLPKLPAAHQVEVRHEFQLAGGAAARGVVFFTVHAPMQADLVALGFPRVDLAKTAAIVALEKEEPATAVAGKLVAETLGCIACHSVDGTTEGKVGPTWLRLFGAKRTFVDGTSDVADDLYLREKILDPQQKKMKPGQVEMPSYRGVLSEQQLESLVLYIRSLTGSRRPVRDDNE